MDFIFDTSFNNLARHEEVRNMMRLQSSFNVIFNTDCVGYPYARIESNNTTIIYRLNVISKNWIMEYLIEGYSDDLMVYPEKYYPYTETESFQTDMLKEIIESGIHIKKKPRFRENDKYVSLFVIYKFGKVLFRIPRTSELVDYLKSKNILY